MAGPVEASLAVDHDHSKGLRQRASTYIHPHASLRDVECVWHTPFTHAHTLLLLL